MSAVYVDIHIHTSENADVVNEKYDCKMLSEKLNAASKGNPILISLTDHNVINKSAYIEMIDRYAHINLILGVELHIIKHEKTEPYHCHIIFDCKINENEIDKINEILNALYPKKMVDDNVDRIPNIEDIANAFEEYDYMLLPHGGQSHRTFDRAVSRNKNFDTIMEKSIYYNQFDGFTSRSNKGIENTAKYLEKLGVADFVNLLTCTDNYDPTKYPNTKVKATDEFVPTWMYAKPSYSGLRLALSESTRLSYGAEPKENACEFIQQIYLKNDFVDIDIALTHGLNVIIGGSSSGKTMLVDMIYRSLNGNFESSKYNKFSIEDVKINYAAQMVPHYINQNFIVNIFQDKDKNIGDIDIINNVFPEHNEIQQNIRLELKEFKTILQELIDTVQTIEKIEMKISKIPSVSKLLINGSVDENIFEKLKPSRSDIKKIDISNYTLNEYKKTLEEIRIVFENNPLLDNNSVEINSIFTNLDRAESISKVNKKVEQIINNMSAEYSQKLSENNTSKISIMEEKKKLFLLIENYIQMKTKFEDIIKKISGFEFEFETKQKQLHGHTLSVTNDFKLSPKVLIEAINKFIKSEHRVTELDMLSPQNLFKQNFSDRPKVVDYEIFVEKVYSELSICNSTKYKIITKDDRRFEDLSPGWKSAILLDLILGFKGDRAPIIIDQPEDNLATDYINNELISALKKMKFNKQMILVSHNATIPILGDAQNIIVCKNEGGLIKIRSGILESTINDKLVLDYIAEITDGGKSAIKKRVKKYNMKSYRKE